MELPHRVLRTVCNNLLLFVYIWIIPSIGLPKHIKGARAKDPQSSLGYKYLDNNLYHVPVITNIPPSFSAEEEFERLFPRPPLFPPPPPSLNDDTNALLRRAIFNHLDIVKLKGDPDNNGNGSHNSNSSLKGDPNWNPCSILHNNNPFPGRGANKGDHHHHSNHTQGVTSPLIGEPPMGAEGVEEVCGAPGPPGEQGEKGRRGKKGRKGGPGPPGEDGKVGPVGPSGLRGRPGSAGRDGGPGTVGPMGPRGYPGTRGEPGTPGKDGTDGIPGLVIFPDAATMYGVALEGLIAYRSDVKLLYFRDNVTWRPIRITRCGDGILDPDLEEECDDGNNNDHDDCVGCRKAYCGDGVRQRGTEECDVRDFGHKQCSSWRQGMIGTLQCTKTCKILYHRCRLPRR